MHCYTTKENELCLNEICRQKKKKKDQTLIICVEFTLVCFGFLQIYNFIIFGI